MNLWKTAIKAVKWGAPALLAPATGGASLAAYGAYGASSANKASKHAADKQMAFQERMSSTEMQRRVQDLTAAGLNPSLAYNLGGASSASGAQPQIVDELSGAVNSAQRGMQQKLALENLAANTENTRAQARLTNVQADNAAAEAPYRQGTAEARINQELYEQRARIDNLIEQADLTSEQKKQIRELLPELFRRARAEATGAELGLSSARAESDLYDTLGAAGKAGGIAGSVANTVRAIIRTFKGK